MGMKDDCFRYRNKAQFPVGYDKEGNLIAGFYAGRTHSIISNTDDREESSWFVLLILNRV